MGSLAGEKGEAAAAEIGWEDATDILGWVCRMLLGTRDFVLLGFYQSFKRIFDQAEAHVMAIGQVVLVSGVVSEIARLMRGQRNVEIAPLGVDDTMTQ